MIKGVVDWFNDPKGFGFIKSNSVDAPLFVHYSSVQGAGHKTLIDGQTVYFNVTRRRTGPEARNVYSQEMYDARLQIGIRQNKLSIESLLENDLFMKELENAFDQMPVCMEPTENWAIEQLIDFEPAKLTRSDIHKDQLELVYSFAMSLEEKFKQEKMKAKKEITRLQYFADALKDEKIKIQAARFKAQISSMNSYKNREQARIVFRNIVTESLSSMNEIKKNKVL